MCVGFSGAACFVARAPFRRPPAPRIRPALGCSHGLAIQHALARVTLPLPALLGPPRALLWPAGYSEIWASPPLSPLHTCAPDPPRGLGLQTPEAWALSMLFLLPTAPFPHPANLRSSLRLCRGVTSSGKPSSPAPPPIPQLAASAWSGRTVTFLRVLGAVGPGGAQSVC